MNARGSTEVIVASIGLSMGVLNQALFTTIVTMAVVTTMSMPPMLRRALGRLPIRPEEAARLEREEFEARGFVSNIERLLVAVDASPSGQLASRLVGLLAGARRIPATVIHFDYETAGLLREGERQAERTKAVVKESAEGAEGRSGRDYHSGREAERRCHSGRGEEGLRTPLRRPRAGLRRRHLPRADHSQRGRVRRAVRDRHRSRHRSAGNERNSAQHSCARHRDCRLTASRRAGDRAGASVAGVSDRSPRGRWPKKASLMAAPNRRRTR